MIEGIDFYGFKDTNMDYLDKFPFFQGKGIEFTPGLNILFSPNGSGKSSILNMIAIALMARQGGYSAVVTGSHWQKTREKAVACHQNGWAEGNPNNIPGFHVRHDGKGIVFADSRHTTGILFGGGFDDDFMQEGIALAMRHNSTGHETMARMEKALMTCLGKAPFPEFKKKDNEKYPSINPTAGVTGPRTIMFDEPESGLTMLATSNIMKLIAKSECQIIMATHSPFALGLKNANIIDVTGKDFDKQIKGLILDLALNL